eukprot:1827754-Alexandrium_andersonii.AAC.1
MHTALRALRVLSLQALRLPCPRQGLSWPRKRPQSGRPWFERVLQHRVDYELASASVVFDKRQAQMDIFSTRMETL